MNKVLIYEYKSDWGNQYQQIRIELSNLDIFKNATIYHIGSTSIPNLDAKDVIDIQAVVPDLKQFDSNNSQLKDLGYIAIPGLSDHVPAGLLNDTSLWAKYFFSKSDDSTRVNLHVRQKGNLNARFALLFRDYLRSNKQMAESYSEAKKALASTLSAKDYSVVKHPIIDIIMVAAEKWALDSSWRLPVK